MFQFEQHFRVDVNRVIDGDTLDVSFYLGLGIWLNTQRIRLRGINTPEMKGEERLLGMKVKQYLVDALNKAEVVVAKTDEASKGKYGRFLAIIYAKLDGKWVNVNKELLRQGAAKEYMASRMDAKSQKEIFDPPPEDLESRLQVMEHLTEEQVYDETTGSSTG
jgi:micrococcal nuclease